MIKLKTLFTGGRSRRGGRILHQIQELVSICVSVDFDFGLCWTWWQNCQMRMPLMLEIFLFIAH